MRGHQVARFEGVTCSAQSDLAILVNVDGRGVWIPFSQLHTSSEVRGKGDSGRLVISLWIAARKGLAKLPDPPDEDPSNGEETCGEAPHWY